MKDFLDIAIDNQRCAYEIIKQTEIMDIWQSVGAEINLVGSLKMGLLMKHCDIDFHVYTSPFNLNASFIAMEKLAENSHIKIVSYHNFLDMEDNCVQWQAIYEDDDNRQWQIDICHIVKDSRYDGYFEHVADRILKVLTDETKKAILRLKYETPESEHIMGIDYYQAVLRDGVRTYDDFKEWRKYHSTEGIVEWIP